MVVAVPSMLITTVTEAPGRVVPAMLGVLSLITDPLTGPVMARSVLEFTVKVDVAVSVLPARSVATASTVWTSLVRRVRVANTQLPLVSTVTLPSCSPSTVMTTVAPGSPVPVISGVASSVVLPSAGLSMRTTVPVSTVNEPMSIASRVPTVTEAVTICRPSDSGVVSGRLQAPIASTSAVPTMVPPMLTVTVVPGVPVPVRVGIAFVIVLPSTGVSMLTATASQLDAAVHTPVLHGVNSTSAGLVQAPALQVSVVHSTPSSHSPSDTQLMHSFAPPVPTTQLGVAASQPRSVPAPSSTHTSHVLPPIAGLQCGAAIMQPASVPVASVSAQVTHTFVGSPEQTSPPVHMPVSPTAIAALSHTFDAQLSTVHGLLSSHCPSAVQTTHVREPLAPMQCWADGVAAEVHPAAVVHAHFAER